MIAPGVAKSLGFRENGHSPTTCDEIINCKKPFFREIIWQYVAKALKMCPPFDLAKICLRLCKDMYKDIHRNIIYNGKD